MTTLPLSPAVRRGVLTALVLFSVAASAQNNNPTINPTATYTKANGEQEVSASYSGNAPLQGHFEACPENDSGWDSYYEWRFSMENEPEPYLIRYEQDTDYTFNDAGTHSIVCYAVFTQGNDTIAYTDEYWGSEGIPLLVTISESLLEMPNAFSPNDDGRNDTYKPLKYQSLVEFHAVIYSRWGQKLYEWDDPAADGWDGTYKGKDVNQGVYFVQVTARGADGRKYNIRRDVNLLRGYTERENSTAAGSNP